MDWTKLTFSYTETDYMVRCHYRAGQWGRLYATKNKNVSIPAAATGLQYAQQAFEGLKVYRQQNGAISIFRPECNAHRMQESARGMLMPEVPTELFLKAMVKAVKKNLRFLPPYGTEATMYLRPILFGTTPRVGVCSADEFEFCVIATPIGPYFPCGFGTTPFVITRSVDRAAPLGTGQWKVGGNYASSFRATEPAHHDDYGVLFLDSKEHRYLDECGGANIFLVKDGVYITPKSDSILPSIINRSLMTLCEDMGIPVEERKIAVEEMAQCQEAASCGTGAAISPISQISDEEKGVVYAFGQEAGPICQKLYKALRDIQFGRSEDKFHWNYIIKL